MKIENFNKRILEPCCGMGHISECLIKHGFDVTSRDLIDRGYSKGESGVNFLEEERIWDEDILTNPPYRYATKFIEKALEITKEGAKIAMFVPLTFLESAERRKLFDTHPPKKVWVSSSRLHCAKGGKEDNFKLSTTMAYIWIVWIKGYKGESNIGWFN